MPSMFGSDAPPWEASGGYHQGGTEVPDKVVIIITVKARPAPHA